jgi:hypothetical protein
MVNPQMVMYEEEFNQIQNVVDRLVKDANAKVVFIVDKNGQLIAASGDVDNLDTTSLASDHSPRGPPRCGPLQRTLQVRRHARTASAEAPARTAGAPAQESDDATTRRSWHGADALAEERWSTRRW